MNLAFRFAMVLITLALVAGVSQGVHAEETTLSDPGGFIVSPQLGFTNLPPGGEKRSESETFTLYLGQGSYSPDFGVSPSRSSISMMGLTYHEFGIGRTALDMSYDLYSRGNHVGSIQSRIEFTDVFYRWAIPEVSFVGGMGVGSSHTDLYISSWSRSTSTDATQFFIRLGVPINEYVEINGAYHIMKISSSSIDMVGTDQQGNSTTTTVYGFDFSGELIGVGLTLKY